MIRNISILTLNDLAITIKNKTILLVFFIPLFVFVTLKLVDSKPAVPEKVKIGLIKNEIYDQKVLTSIKSAPGAFAVSDIADLEEGKELIKEKKIDALLLKSEVLIVLKRQSITTLTVLESFQALQKAVEGRNVYWISKVESLIVADVQKQSLPIWILMLVLLVSFVIMPSQVAEEKEKKLLVSLLQTPMREIEWLLSKVLVCMILICVSLVFLHMISDMKIAFNIHYILFLIIGSFCFSAYGVLLGFLCRNQATARTLGVIFYLPHLLPAALSEYSAKLSSVAPLVPSFQFIESVKKIIFEQSTISQLSFELTYLAAIGLLAVGLSYYLLKRRWLM